MPKKCHFRRAEIDEDGKYIDCALCCVELQISGTVCYLLYDYEAAMFGNYTSIIYNMNTCNFLNTVYGGIWIYALLVITTFYHNSQFSLFRTLDKQYVLLII